MKSKISLLPIIIVVLFTVLIPHFNCYDDKYYSCNHRIYSENLLLSQNELHRLCDLLLKKDRFTILITERKEFRYEQDYNKEAEEFFNKHCTYNAIPCNYCFSIAIFANVKKFRITSGHSASNMLSKNQWETITQAMVSKLKRGDYYDSIEDGISWLDQSAPYDSSKDFPKHDDRDDHKNNNKSGFGFGSFVLYIILPCCGLGALWYYYYYKPKIENANDNNPNSDANMPQFNNAFVSEPISDNSQKGIIHFHINYLLELLKQIKTHMPPIYNTDKCIICQQKIQFTASKQYIEMLQIGNNGQQSFNQSIDNLNTRFGCLHLYHRDCLRKYNLGKCIMCFQTSQNATEVILNNYDTQVLEENHIISLIKNLPLIYSTQDLKDYSLSYNSEYSNLSQTYVPNLDSLWQISNNSTNTNSNYINSYTPPNNYYNNNSQREPTNY